MRSLALAVVLTGLSAILCQASASTLTPESIAADSGELKHLLASCCNGTNGLGNTGTNNIGIGNSGSRNIGINNSGTGNIGAFNGLGNSSSTSGNHNLGLGNGNGNTSVNSGNGNLGVGNGNGNASSNSGNGNVGAFNGNLNGIGNVGGNATYNGNNNVGAFNGNLNGNGNVGSNSGSYNGNDNVGVFNGNLNGNGNVGNDNGNFNGNGNVGAFNGNENGSGNVGQDNGNWNGNYNSGILNGNQNGNGNVGTLNGNENGNYNIGINNGNQNGNNNFGFNNGNQNGNGNVNVASTGLNSAASADFGVESQSLQTSSIKTLTPNPTASDGVAVDFGHFEQVYDFTLSKSSDVQFGGIAVGIFDFDMNLCYTAACSGSDLIDSGYNVPGTLLSITGGWDVNMGPGIYYLIVSGFGAPTGGAYLAGLIVTPVAATPIPPSILMLLTGLVPLACAFRLRRRGMLSAA